MKQRLFGAAAALVVVAAVGVAGIAVFRANASGGTDVKVEVRLTNTGVDPLASGKAKGEQRPDRVRFGVEVEDVSTNGGHEVRVTRNGTPVADSEGLAVSVDALGFGDLNLDSRDGNTVPVVAAGDLVEVLNPSGQVILSGTLVNK
jgi:hypothetical protein